MEPKSARKKGESPSLREPRAHADRGALPAITVESLRDKVVSSLKDAFLSGLLKPGDAIVERQVAQQMGVGSPAVREALITLEQQGYVKRVANTATYVKKFSVDDVRQLYELRIELELLAMKWFKRKVTDEDLSALERYVEAMVVAARGKDSRAFFENDLEFHRHCWKRAGNKYLEKTLENLVPALFAFVLNSSQNESVQESVARQHLSIIHALKSAYEPEFSTIIREALNWFALQAVSSLAGVNP
jgi:DNA-binding GntR family transcriptional regulator